MRVQRVLAVAVVFLFLVSLGFGQTQGRVEPYNLSIVDVGYKVGTCFADDPAEFDILGDDIALLSGMIRYDKDGNPVQERYQFRLIGQSKYYNSMEPDKFVLGGPGENQEARIAYEDGAYSIQFNGGLYWKVVLKGYGPILLDCGHAVYDWETGQLVFKKGPNEFHEGDFAALCNALK